MMGPTLSGGPYALDNFPPGTYAIFVITISEHMGIYPRGVRVELVPGSEQRVQIPWVESAGIGEANLWMFDNTVRLEQRTYSVQELCTLLSQATGGRIELLADASIQNEEARLPASEMSIWDVLESLYLTQGWVVTEESRTRLILKPGQPMPRETPSSPSP